MDTLFKQKLWVQFDENRLDKEKRKIEKFMSESDAPDWYRGMSEFQLQAAENLLNALRDDREQATCHRVLSVLSTIGLHPLIREKQAYFLMMLSRGSDLAFLWFLYEIFYKTQGKQLSINEQLIMSSIAHLDLQFTLRGLKRILPPEQKPKRSATRTEKMHIDKRASSVHVDDNVTHRVADSFESFSQSTFKMKYKLPYFNKPIVPRPYGKALHVQPPIYRLKMKFDDPDENTIIPNEANRWFGSYAMSSGKSLDNCINTDNLMPILLLNEPERGKTLLKAFDVVTDKATQAVVFDRHIFSGLELPDLSRKSERGTQKPDKKILCQHHRIEKKNEQEKQHEINVLKREKLVKYFDITTRKNEERITRIRKQIEQNVALHRKNLERQEVRGNRKSYMQLLTNDDDICQCNTTEIYKENLCPSKYHKSEPHCKPLAEPGLFSKYCRDTTLTAFKAETMHPPIPSIKKPTKFNDFSNKGTCCGKQCFEYPYNVPNRLPNPLCRSTTADLDALEREQVLEYNIRTSSQSEGHIRRKSRRTLGTLKLSDNEGDRLPSILRGSSKGSRSTSRDKKKKKNVKISGKEKTSSDRSTANKRLKGGQDNPSSKKKQKQSRKPAEKSKKEKSTDEDELQQMLNSNHDIFGNVIRTYNEKESIEPCIGDGIQITDRRLCGVKCKPNCQAKLCVSKCDPNCLEKFCHLKCNPERFARLQKVRLKRILYGDKPDVDYDYIKSFDYGHMEKTNKQQNTAKTDNAENTGESGKEEGLYFKAPDEHSPYNFDYKKIFSFEEEVPLQEDLIRNEFLNALDCKPELGNQPKNIAEAVNQCAVKMFKEGAQVLKDEHQAAEDKVKLLKEQQRLSFEMEYYDPEDEQLMHRMLKEALEILAKDPRYVLATFKDADKYPLLVYWMYWRYGRTYTQTQLENIFKKSLPTLYALKRMTLHVSLPSARKMGRAIYVQYGCHDYLMKKTQHIRKAYYAYLNNIIMEQSRCLYMAMNPQLCVSGLPNNTYFAYMPSSVANIYHFRVWRPSEHHNGRETHAKRMVELRRRQRYV